MKIKIDNFNSFSQKALNNTNIKMQGEYNLNNNQEQDRIIYNNLGKSWGSQNLKTALINQDGTCGTEKKHNIGVLKKNSSNYTTGFGFVPNKARISEVRNLTKNQPHRNTTPRDDNNIKIKSYKDSLIPKTEEKRLSTKKIMTISTGQRSK